MKRLVTLVLSAVMLFTAVSAPVTAQAATGKVKTLKVVSVSATSVKLKWKKVKGADSYKVYYSTSKNKNYKYAKTVKKKNTAIVKKLGDNKTYYFKVKAVKNGKTGSASPAASATTKKQWGKITGVKVKKYNVAGFYSWEDGGGGFECILVDFDKVADADGYQVAWYIKYHGYESDVTLKYIKNNRFRYGHQDIAPIFKVRAYKKTGAGTAKFGPWKTVKAPKNYNTDRYYYLEDYEATIEKDYETVETIFEEE